MINGILVLVGLSHAFYGANRNVIQLTESNFNSKVLKSDGMWIVEFFAPWSAVLLYRFRILVFCF